VPQGAGQIQGTVVSAANGEPLAAVSVMVRGAADSALAGGALTRDDGGFRIAGLRPGRYNVLVRSVGFAPLARTGLVVTADAPTVDLGRLQLATVATKLAGVSVQGERQQAALAPDRNSYTVKDMPTTTGGTAVDVLRNVPSVEVDGDNKVSLRGNSNVVVQINGRASPMRGEQLGNFLAQLPANTVARVEVVPNPSAKEDPEGLGGIINIVLKQGTDLGTSGGMTIGGGTTGQLNGSANLGRQQGAWTLFGSYGYMQDRRSVVGITTRENSFADPVTYLDYDIDGLMTPRSHNVTTSVEYKGNERDVLSSNLIFNARAFGRESDSYYRNLDANRDVTGRAHRFTDQDQHDFTLDHALAWRRTMEPQKHFFSTELRVSMTRSDNGLFLSDETLGADGTPGDVPVGLETNDTDERSNNLFLQGDYTRTLGASTKLETGFKGTGRQMTSDFDVALATEGDPYAPDATRSNAFTYDERIGAAYAVLSQKVGRVELQGGLRLERADTRFDLATTGERYDNDYGSVFPSAIATWNVTESRQLKASYSKRINRPSTQQLNPFGFREDALNVFRGNPQLQPEYTHAFELGYQQSLGKGSSLQLTPFFRRTVDAVRFIGSVDDAGVSTTTFRNVATNDSYGADANLSLKLGRLSGFGGASAFWQKIDASNLADVRSIDSFGWSARLNATLKVTPALEVQGFTMYRAPLRIEQGRITAFSLANLAIKQKLDGDRSSLTFRVADPFRTMQWGVRATDGRVIQAPARHFGARGAFLTDSYNFGTAPKIRQRPPEQDGGQGVPGAGPPG
jgi:outer membrane receptor protein involved in Fe transport